MGSVGLRPLHTVTVASPWLGGDLRCSICREEDASWNAVMLVVWNDRAAGSSPQHNATLSAMSSTFVAKNVKLRGLECK